MSRGQRESMYQRMLFLGLAIAAGLIVLIIGAGVFYEYQIKPNQVLAEVNGEEITREDYWRYQNVTLYNQARLYEDYALQVTGQQQTQFLTYAAQLDAAREDVWGSTDVSEATIGQMIEDRLFVAAAEDQGVDMSRETLEAYALNSFAPVEQPLVTPMPSPTLIPERAAWATETAEAMQTQESLALGTPAGSDPAPAATPIGTPAATPIGTPATAEELATVRLNAEAEFAVFQDEVLDEANMTLDQYYEQMVKPLVARDVITSGILANVPQSTPQVELRHILVGTEDLAQQVYQRVTGDEAFEDVAVSTSIDTITSPTGGNLGWVTDQQLPDAVSDLAFSTDPGEIAGPVESEFGWHVIEVLDRDDDRAMTQTQYDLAVDTAQTTWLETSRETYGVSSDHYSPTPVPTAASFIPPADAPTPIVATPVPAPDLSATPIAGPQFAPQATPPASPAATPAASPAGSPAATPAD